MSRLYSVVLVVVDGANKEKLDLISTDNEVGVGRRNKFWEKYHFCPTPFLF